MEKITRYIIDVIGIGEPNLDTVGQARWAFIGDTQWEPDQIVLSHLAYKQLMSNLKPEYAATTGINPTFMGLTINVDGSFRDGEWRVRKETEQTYAIKG